MYVCYSFVWLKRKHADVILAFSLDKHSIKNPRHKPEACQDTFFLRSAHPPSLARLFSLSRAVSHTDCVSCWHSLSILLAHSS